MVGLIIVTHAGLAAELLNAVETIVGPISHVCCHTIDQGIDLEVVHEMLRDSIDEVGVDGDGVMIMTDMFGGTPSNVSARFLKKDLVEVINGVNLPMLIKFSSSRESMGLTVLANFLKKYGQKSMILTSDIFSVAEG